MKLWIKSKKVIIIFCFILLIILLCVGLNKKNNIYNSNKNSPSTIIYSRLENKLLKYDTNEGEYVLFNNQENLFQYEFPNEESEIITSGNSITNNFSILKKSDTKIQELKTISNDEALFPLDIYENDYYFIHYYYDNSGNELTRKVSIWDEDSNTLIDLDIVVDKIVSGVILRDTLYFISYDDKQDYYNLFKININNYSDKTLLKSNLNNDNLFKFNDDIMFINNHNKIENLENKEIKPLTIGSKNYIRGNYFITLDDSDSRGVRIKMYDMLTSKLVIQEDEAIDFIFTDNIVKIIDNNYH